MAPIKNKVVSPPKPTARRRRPAAAGKLHSLALSQLDDALQEGQASVSELLKILSLPAAQNSAAPTLPDGWTIIQEKKTDQPG